MIRLTGSIAIFCALTAGATPSTQTAKLPETDTVAAVVTGYAEIAAQLYTDIAESAQQMHQAIQQLVAEPSAENHLAAQQAWLDVRRIYGQSEVYRFYGGPVDDARGLEARINAWPVDEAYLDYVLAFDGKTMLSDGLINQPDLVISRTNIVAANERDGEKNISMGFHAIEFLLWGQDVYDDSAGRRDYRDYSSADFAQRRGDYLLIISALLVENLQQLAADWMATGSDGYRRQFIDGGPQSLVNILTGMQVLAGFELAGERLEVALDTYDQEDEHSCFSDNTHVDIRANIQGIHNVFAGRYEDEQGKLIDTVGVSGWLRTSDPQAHNQAQAALNSARELAAQFQPPFDQAIQDPQQRELLQQLVMQLRLFARIIKNAQLSVAQSIDG